MNFITMEDVSQKLADILESQPGAEGHYTVALIVAKATTKKMEMTPFASSVCSIAKAIEQAIEHQNSMGSLG